MSARATTTTAGALSAQRIAEALEGSPKNSGGSSWLARCPAHDDERPSLGIDAGADGRPLVKCYAGCSQAAVIGALRARGLWPLKAAPAGPAGARRIVATYPYRDESGALLFEALRYEPKGFAQRRPDGKGGWLWKLDGVRRVLYRLPELLAANAAEVVFVVEGEKDTDNLRALGLVATSSPHGAGKWRPEFAEALRGRRVVVIADKDEPGRAHAFTVARSLRGVAAGVKVIEVPGDAKDASDWLAAGGDADALLRLVDAAPEVVEPPAAGPRPGGAGARAGSEEEIRETDVGNALRLVARHGDDLHFCAALGGWLAWDGARWQPDDTGEIVRRARETVRAIFAELADEQDPDRRAALFQHATRSENEARIAAMTKLARADARVAARPDDFDADPMVLNVANGILDLRSGALRPHARAERMTKLVPIAYDPTTTCATWERFLASVMGGAFELVAFLRRAIGYTLTGETREHAIFFLHGSGSNGKSTLVETLRALLGDYARGADFETFLARDRSGTAREDLARLRGARLVTAAEAPDGRRFDETALKGLTGGDSVTARDFYKSSFEYYPAFKLWLSGNHKPRITGADEGIWRRFHMVPFGVRFHDDMPENAHLPIERRKDGALPARLVAELPGILAWAVAGCLEWQRDGLRPPGAVRAATQKYRAEMDQIGDFLEARCVVFPNARVGSQELYAAYSKWCAESGERAASLTIFGTRLGERPGPVKARDRFGRMGWLGVGLARESGEGSEGFEAHSPKPLTREGIQGELTGNDLEPFGNPSEVNQGQPPLPGGAFLAGGRP